MSLITALVTRFLYKIQHWWERTKLPHGWQRDELKARQKEWRRRWFCNEPLTFSCLPNDWGTPVGPPIKVFHCTADDIADHVVPDLLTEEVLLKGKSEINGYRKVRFERTGEFGRVTTIQPVHFGKVTAIQPVPAPDPRWSGRHFGGRGGSKG